MLTCPNSVNNSLNSISLISSVRFPTNIHIPLSVIKLISFYAFFPSPYFYVLSCRYLTETRSRTENRWLLQVPWDNFFISESGDQGSFGTWQRFIITYSYNGYVSTMHLLQLKESQNYLKRTTLNRKNQTSWKFIRNPI